MSDLQIALAGIGIVVIGLVYAYNLWQERRLRKTLDRAFAAPDADVLLDPADGRVEPVINRPGSPGEGSQSDALPDSGEGLPADPVLDHCMAVYCAVDTAIVLREAVGTALAAFGDRVRVTGVSTPDRVATSDVPAFLVAAQLVDRSGALDEEVLAVVQETVAEVCQVHGGTVSSEEPASVAVARGRALDAVIAESDILIGFNILPTDDAGFDEERVRASAITAGFEAASGGQWRLRGEQSANVATLVPFEASHGSSAPGWDAGVTILVDVPRVADPCEAIDKAAATAAAMAKDLGGMLVDDNRKPLTVAGIEAIRSQLAAISARMAEHGIAPGSPRALRLFE